jgi:hypothetical protein
MILFNALTPSTTIVQARQDAGYLARSDVHLTPQEDRSIPTFEHPLPRLAEPEKNIVKNAMPQGSGILFIENVGQFDKRARFVVQGSNAYINLSQDEIWFTIFEKPEKEDPNKDNFIERVEREKKSKKTVNLKLVFPGSNPKAKIESFDRLDLKVSYLRSNGQYPNVPLWGGVRYVDLYPGVDLELTGKSGELTWRIVIKNSEALSSPDSYIKTHGLKIKVAGQKNLAIEKGKVNIDTELGGFLFPQVIVDGLANEQTFTSTPKTEGDEIFLIYPKTLSSSFGSSGMFIPVSYIPVQNFLNVQSQTQTSEYSNLIFAMLLGGGVGDSTARGQAAGTDGSMFVTGETDSLDFPTQAGYDNSYNGYSDAFVTKIRHDGTLEYSTYLGGNYDDEGLDIEMNQNGDAYILGDTNSTDFPLTDKAISTDWSRGFLSILNAGGNQLLYSSFIGSDDMLEGIGIDSNENVYILDDDGIAYKLKPGDNKYTYVSPVGLISEDMWWGMTVSENGNAYFSGEGMASAITNAGNSVHFAPFGSGTGVDIAVDAKGFVYVTGYISSRSSNFPVVGSPVSGKGICSVTYLCHDAFIVIFNSTGSIEYSSYLDLGGDDYGYGVEVDDMGNVYLVGYTDSVNFPSTNGALDITGGKNAFIVRLSPDIPLNKYSIAYATEVGGLECDISWSGATTDSFGNVYLSGYTRTHLKNSF